MITVVWFKKDFRTHDHFPLFQAFKEAYPILPLYIFEPDYWHLPDTSKRHWSFIKDSIQDLGQQLKDLNLELSFKIGSVETIFSDLKKKHPLFKVYSHQETGNMWTYKRDISLSNWFKKNNILWQEFPNNGVIRKLKTRDIWASLHKKRMAASQLILTRNAPALVKEESHPIPEIAPCFFGEEVIGSVQRGGRKRGLDLLASFLKDRSTNYRQSLSKPGPSYNDCSRLSPHITYGTLSVREIFHACWQQIKDDKNNNASYKAKNITAMVSRLYWHCHFIQKLEDDPDIEFKCMHKGYEGLRDKKNVSPHLSAWTQGKTGFPLVDASMRCLSETGWLNFRMRAMVVSFAAYHLWIDWRLISPILARLFTDYEPGIHYSQLQMQSGVTGINTIRVYNPIKQSYDNDSEGIFIKRYIPELRDVSIQWLHEPWKMPQEIQEKYTCLIGTHYPKPIINHEIAAKQAKQKLSSYRSKKGFRLVSQKVYQKHGSRKRTNKIKQKDNQLNLL